MICINEQSTSIYLPQIEPVEANQSPKKEIQSLKNNHWISGLYQFSRAETSSLTALLIS